MKPFPWRFSRLPLESLRPRRRAARLLVLAANLLLLTGTLDAATNSAPNLRRINPKTNTPPVVQRTGGKTNAPPAAGSSKAKAVSWIPQAIRQLPASRAFYPAVVAFSALCIAALFWLRHSKSRRTKAGQTPSASQAPKAAAGPARKKAAKAAIHSCNVLQTGAESKRLWQFDARGTGFALNREQTSPAGEPLPASIVAKNWRSLYQRKLNIAWLPPEHVFLRVAQFPQSDFEETLAMVELQLEKLSPMPVAQIVWSLEILPHAADNLQTVILMIVSRGVVEEFLGQLEGQGYLADRLELPLLAQLQATTISENGVWIYPEAAGGKNIALAAWWYGGVLRNLDLISLPAADRPARVKEQLLQTAWAGELEGWLTSRPRWHLVAAASAVAEWEPALRAGFEEPVELIAPLPASQVAALTATHAAQAELLGNLLPAEFSTRYHQQFVDRLWMRGLGAVVALYIVGVLIYGVAVGFATYQTRQVEQRVVELGPTYTNALLLKARSQVLKDRQELKYAALDCWNITARLMADNLTLDSFNFSEGKRLTLSGSAPADQVKALIDFEAAMRKADLNGQVFFDPGKGDNLSYHANPGAGSVNWNFALELKRSEEQ